MWQNSYLYGDFAGSDGSGALRLAICGLLGILVYCVLEVWHGEDIELMGLAAGFGVGTVGFGLVLGLGLFASHAIA